MSSAFDAPAIEAPTRLIARSRFYVGMSVAMLLIVFVGFARTLYLRQFFDVPAISLVFWVHGITMTAWYAGATIQTSLITARRTDLHMKLGWALVAVAVAALASALAVDFTFAPRRLAAGAPIELSVLSILIVAIAVDDVVTRRRVHPVTLAGGPLLIATKVLFVYVVARTAFGVNTVVGG